MKNLVVIHLESLSSKLYNVFAEDMPFISSLKKRSIDYTSCFSTSTSTEMTKIGLFMKNKTLGDDLELFLQRKVKIKGSESIFSRLEKTLNYHTLGMIYTDNTESVWSVWKDTFKEFIPEINNENSLLEKLKGLCDGEQPYALYLHALYSHVACGLSIKHNEKTFLKRQQKGFKSVDDLIEKIYIQLNQAGELDNTLFVFFGDHGDDSWIHSYHPHLVHGFIPHSTQTHVPFFLFSEKESPSKISEICSLAEGSITILEELGCNSDGFEPTTNIVINDKIGKIVFSQNLFTNQFPKAFMEKGYSVASDNYILVSSQYGLEMYDWKHDPENQHNLLRYLYIKNRKLQIINEPLKDRYTRFMFSEEILNALNIEFFELQKALIYFIKNKEDNLESLGVLKYPYPMKYCNKFNKRLFHPSFLMLKYPRFMRYYVPAKTYIMKKIALLSFYTKRLCSKKNHEKNIN